jgi:hypothetical protein
MTLMATRTEITLVNESDNRCCSIVVAVRDHYDPFGQPIVWRVLPLFEPVIRLLYDEGTAVLELRRGAGVFADNLLPGRYRILCRGSELTVKKRSDTEAATDYRVHNCARTWIKISLSLGGNVAIRTPWVAHGQTARLRVQGLYFGLAHGTREGSRLDASIRGAFTLVHLNGIRKCVMTLRGAGDSGYQFAQFVELGAPENIQPE